MSRLLLVDDEAAFRTLMRMLLEHDPALKVVGEAADGQEAIDRARALQPDAILLDLNMPGVNGPQALPRLLTVAPKAHIIIVSVAHDDANLHKAKFAGAHGFIDKALDNDAFVEAVHACLSGPDAWTVRQVPPART